MANDELDLGRGDPSRADSTSERRRRRRESRTESNTPASEGITEGELRHQLGRAFDGLAKGREARDDSELADAIREEGEAMTEGFVTLTNNVKALRLPLVILLNVLITILAFGRVGGILWDRYKVRRERRQAERAASLENGVQIIEE